MTDRTVSLSDWLDRQIGEGKTFRNNTDLAKLIGVDEKTIRRMLDGETPGLKTLQKLANGLNYPIEELQKMAGILADDQGVQDDITSYILGGLKRLPRSQRKH